jgi:hypothetical protein
MTMNDFTDDGDETSVRARVAGVVFLIGVAIYLGLGVAYAATRPDVVAGLTGASHVVGIVTQVVAWPIWAFGLA